MKSLAVAIAAALIVAFVPSTSFCMQQEITEDFPYDKTIWPTDLRIKGSVLAWNGYRIPDELLNAFLQQDEDAGGQVLFAQLGKAGDNQSISDELLESLSAKKVVVENADSPPEGLKDDSEQFKAIWVHGFTESKDIASLLDSVKPFVEKGMTDGIPVLFSGTAYTWAAKQRASLGQNRIDVTDGLALFPDTVITSAEDKRGGLAVAALNPQLVTISIPNETGILLRGRKIRVLGEGKVDFQVLANDRQPNRVLRFGEGKGRRLNPYRELIDLTAWRRDAIDRTLPAFPPAEPAKPNVENGTLVIVGGGGMPDGLIDKFIQLAGGKDAKIVFVPCSERDEVPKGRLARAMESRIASSTQLHTKDRHKADTDEEFLKHLSEATGVWFGGGRQWNFVDSYYGTTAHRLMLDVMDRGGVIGGSSAGASIQGEYLARANPVANFDIMAAGYERGLGFLQGVAIDQHFSQRQRQKDMTSLVDTYPQLLGIGIDEGTALIVKKSIGEVTGKGKVFFYDRNQPVVPGQDDFVALGDGERFDLAERKVIEQE